ncbi:MAG: hypothetical protein JW900_10625 [Anaerolineae bacterium]|nr:hypothetical protein [Anaerolineae bacterium]
MRRALRWLLDNIGTIVLSLILAVAIWVVAQEQQDPTVEQRYPSTIPVTIPAPPEGMIVYGQTETQVRFTLRAPDSIWQVLQPEDVHATINLDGLEAGSHQVPIQVVVNQGPVMVSQISPEAITINLEAIAETQLPIEIQVNGQTAVGYTTKSPIITPATTTITGPTSFVSQVARVVGTVSVDGERDDVRGEASLQALNNDGEAVRNVTLTPDHVAVHVPVEQLHNFKDLAVTAWLEGQVASGYRIASITVDPPLVTVLARENAEDIPNYVRTAPLNIDGAWENVEVQLPLELPDNVALVGDVDLVTVFVTIVPRRGSMTLYCEVEIQGWGAGITATVVPTAVEVTLSGPLPVLGQLQEDDVRIIVDLFGLNPGIHSVVPRVVIVPTGEVEAAILPETVRVEITLEVTPTPEE